MKIAFASDDGRNISSHFGQAEFYVVVEIANGEDVERRLISKDSTECNCSQQVSLESVGGPGSEGHSHHHEHGDHEQKHKILFEPIKDCQLVIARGMGSGAVGRLEKMEIEVTLTSHKEIEKALNDFLTGKLQHETKRLH